ncbi:MAG: HNH endonuclease [Sciscionella sp.]
MWRTAKCGFCGEGFDYQARKMRFCSNECQAGYKRLRRGVRDAVGTTIRCAWCAAQFVKGSTNRHYCSTACADAAYRDQKGERDADKNHIRRSRCKGSASERIDRLTVYVRDKWICGLCHDKIDWRLTWPNLKSVSLDHIVPLSAGGTHTYDNVQAAHLSCNSIAGDKRGGRRGKAWTGSKADEVAGIAG